MSAEVREFVVHCFAQRLPDGQWQAFSIQFGLAVQGESCAEVKSKLHSMIHDYLTDAIEGEDREFCKQLLSRRAPLRIEARYWLFRLLFWLSRRREKQVIFDELFNDAVAC